MKETCAKCVEAKPLSTKNSLIFCQREKAIMGSDEACCHFLAACQDYDVGAEVLL